MFKDGEESEPFGVTIGRRIPAISVAFVMEDPLPLLTNGMGRSCVS